MGKKSALSRWYASLYTRRIDLVGDYAGTELFLIEGDSLLLHAFSDPLLDFGDAGFQLLHAAYNVEVFLKKLKARGCNFHIAFFDDHRQLCVPALKDEDHREKYFLARAAVIRHLHRNVDEALTKIYAFEGITSAPFLDYLHDAGCYFVLCHDGSGAEKESKAQYQWMIHWLAQKGWNVALINGLECHDTKIMTMVLEAKARAVTLPQPKHLEAPNMSTLAIRDAADDLQALEAICDNENISLSERETITILVGHRLWRNQDGGIVELSKLLLHTAALAYLPLTARYLPDVEESSDDMIESFTETALDFLTDRSFLLGLDAAEQQCDVADLFDGRLYFALCKPKRQNLAYLYAQDSPIVQRWKLLGSILSRLSADDGSVDGFVLLETKLPAAVKSKVKSISAVDDCGGVLPFAHPVLDQHLAPIRITIDKTEEKVSGRSSAIFSEISHWHNADRPLVTKGHQVQKLGFHAHKRNQYFMTEMINYAASLTNAVGKSLDPEIIVVKDSTKAKARSKLLIEDKPKKARDKSAHKQQKGGRAAAFAAAEALQASKMQQEERKFLSAWDAECKEIVKTTDWESRYLKIDKYLNLLPKKGQTFIAPEVALFKMVCLHEICSSLALVAKTGVQYKQTMLLEGYRVNGYVAIIWDTATTVARQAHGVTSSVGQGINKVLSQAGLPVLDFTVLEADRCLPFKLPDMQKASTSALKVYTGDDSRIFQLGHCGPYFDRSFDSRPDPRVPFQPDAWQRKVLDAIDEEKSLLVLAPTSAGKTFISFYAMKQTLETSDDSILVYVAPTKALVNQIAAEVQARFSKNLKYEGRSVWGIHTRDYRINNPTGCQVLVTVPHILQIMLLAPSHAAKENSWSNRIRRIIFDEVHCIGQADDGLIWEQLLILAPCPIIALSATVGNPDALGAWLQNTQEALGNELVVVQHKTRYSDLRKFIYNPPTTFQFRPLQASSAVQIPGLDGTAEFSLVHPVASLIDRSRGIPEDLSLEPRDCLSLYRAMVKHQTESHPVKASLNPSKALPKIIKKSDILNWETDLKLVLRAWMTDPLSPFPAVLKEVSKSLKLKSRCLADQVDTDADQVLSVLEAEDELQTTLPMLTALNDRDALPAIIFNFDRGKCEVIAQTVSNQLRVAENAYKDSTVWQRKLKEWEEWKKAKEKARQLRKKVLASQEKAKKKRNGDDDEERGSKLDRMMTEADDSSHPMASFAPNAPVQGYHFMDERKLSMSELEDYCAELRKRGVSEWLLRSLLRGIGVHHAGMNRKYRQVVEILFRKGFLRVVIATGTLALGINMPCKTVVFSGDSVFLTALNFRQAAGRAGRRGFDVLGNVVFQGISPSKVCRLLSSRLPDLNGHFPITTSLVLRLFTLLHETKNGKFATNAVNAILSQPRLYLGGEEAKMTVLHHLRFSIEYLRRQSLLGSKGEPLNFAGLVSHLYYTENSGFAFHVLLKAGFFHRLCAGVQSKTDVVLRELMLTMAHLFGRLPLRKVDKQFAEEVIKHSPSMVILPPMPNDASTILASNHDQTLDIYRNYVATFVAQHVQHFENRLPFSGVQAGSDDSLAMEAPRPQVQLRSPFVALSGHDDHFKSIHDLCATVRHGVFLEENVIPHIDVGAKDSVLNAYLYDFFKHGDVTALVNANKIRRGEVWFKLNDFSLVLATIIASMKNFMGLKADDEDFADLRGSGDAAEELAGEESDGEEEELGGGTWSTHGGGGMAKVLKAFVMLKASFDEKFKVMWA